ncbi:excisionase family protein [Yersinia enterocolitica]|uniref:excisionase family protein n=1 Tax=Yersinia TaxID=629 RepID=UPI0005E66D25|nr:MULTISPECIES: excisionase family protein [Yersinia]MCB5307434.1 excisionase family protein [Yersinia massiliensis]CNJ14558.1 putative phage excisionase [Yersinia aldovae]
MVNLTVVDSPSMIQLQANEWVTQAVLASITGFSPGKIRSYRQRGWRQGKEWLLVAPTGTPGKTSEALYNIPAINIWIANQASNQPAV